MDVNRGLAVPETRQLLNNRNGDRDRGVDSFGAPRTPVEHGGSFSTSIRAKLSEEQIRETVNQKLIETGERERLVEYLRNALEECGWRDELKQQCKGMLSSARLL